jgi:hypothetical protein
MKALKILAAATLLAGAAQLAAQANNVGDLGEVVVTAQRVSQAYYQQERPVVGLRRQADSAVQAIQISSDSRDENERKSEIQAVLAAALDRAGAAGVELVTGNFELVPTTKTNAKDLTYFNAGRPDTSRVVLMVKAKLAGSTVAAQQRIDAFVKSVPKSGRGLLEGNGGLSLTIINPDQYRDAIVKAVAEHATRYAALFGPEYRVSVTGLDGQVAWSQVSGSDVFLYVPYRYSIVAR